MATHDTKLGIGKSTGMFFHAKAGTSLPTYPSATLSSAWEEVGDISVDGITLATDKSTENLRNWANKIKRVIVSEHTETIQAPVMDTTQDTLETILGEDAVEVTPAGSGHGKTIKASLSQDQLPPEEAYLFLMKDDDDLIAIGCTNGQITALENVSFAPNSAITWTPTITALEDGWDIILEEAPEESDS